MPIDWPSSSGNGIEPKSSTIWCVSYSRPTAVTRTLPATVAMTDADAAFGPYRLVYACAADHGGRVAPYWLLCNAVAPGGNIWIELEVAGSEATLRVRDDGKGIPHEMQKEIFKPLVTGRSGQGGTGLGLAVSDRIVRGLGGSITVASEPGCGAEFRVRLPLLVTTAEVQGIPDDASTDHR